MAGMAPEITVQLPLLDRLIDQDPMSGVEGPQSRASAVRALKDAIRRDLEWLLNTRQTPLELPKSCAELRKCVFNYGLPDLTSFTLHSQADEAYLLDLLQRTIAIFEPRLLQVKVVAREPFQSLERTLRFHIEALLLLDPAPESVSFDTVFKVDQGACEVKG
jgi:type VI secretion system protein ImpF